jgi:hypothetical protein
VTYTVLEFFWAQWGGAISAWKMEDAFLLSRSPAYRALEFSWWHRMLTNKSSYWRLLCAAFIGFYFRSAAFNWKDGF